MAHDYVLDTHYHSDTHVRMRINTVAGMAVLIRWRSIMIGRAATLHAAGTGTINTAASSGCSEQRRNPPPTKQEIRANGIGDASGGPGRHSYRSDDNRSLVVDFKNEGLTLDRRRDADAAPIVLTAPAPGLQYVGDTMSATFSGNEIKIEEADKRPVLCRKATSL